MQRNRAVDQTHRNSDFNPSPGPIKRESSPFFGDDFRYEEESKFGCGSGRAGDSKLKPLNDKECDTTVSKSIEGAVLRTTSLLTTSEVFNLPETPTRPAGIRKDGLAISLRLGLQELKKPTSPRIVSRSLQLSDVALDTTMMEPFEPEKVRFCEMTCGIGITLYYYEAFDWDEFDEDTIYGPLPAFDPMKDLWCTDPDSEEGATAALVGGGSGQTFVVKETRPIDLKSILKHRNAQDDTDHPPSVCEGIENELETLQTDPSTRKIDTSVCSFKSPIIPSSTRPEFKNGETLLTPVTSEPQPRLSNSMDGNAPVAGSNGLKMPLAFFF